MPTRASNQTTRMRNASKMVRQQTQWHYPADLLMEAADTIDMLRKENDELRAERDRLDDSVGYWKTLLYDRTETLRVRAERAEAECDRWKGYAKVQRIDRHKARKTVTVLENSIQAHRDDIQNHHSGDPGSGDPCELCKLADNRLWSQLDDDDPMGECRHPCVTCSHLPVKEVQPTYEEGNHD